MTVKQFFGSYNIGRSAIKKATIVSNCGDDTYTYSERELREDAYGPRGNLKINTFTITDDNIVVYARS